MEVDNAPVLCNEAAQPVEFEAVPSCSSAAADQQMDAEEIHQHIREASQSPNAVPLLARFVNVLDQLDTRVERLRKEAMMIQEKRDQLLISLDLVKNNDLFANLEEHERDEVIYYMERINSRLGTVELAVRTVRNQSQEDCLHQVNVMIDNLINSQDMLMSREICLMYLNSCAGDEKTDQHGNEAPLPTDKKFENALLGATLDDQKETKKRLTALLSYFNKRTIVE